MKLKLRCGCRLNLLPYDMQAIDFEFCLRHSSLDKGEEFKTLKILLQEIMEIEYGTFNDI